MEIDSWQLIISSYAEEETTSARKLPPQMLSLATGKLEIIPINNWLEN